MDKNTFMSLYQRPFAEQIAFNIEQLEYRYERLSGVDTTKKENQSEYLMLFDSLLSLFRALFLERGTKPYSIQNFYREKGQNDVAQKIDDYLDSQMFSWSDKSIRDVLKFIADKFVCHVDPILYEDLGWANFYMSSLMNPCIKNNLKDIMNTIFQIMSNN